MKWNITVETPNNSIFGTFFLDSDRVNLCADVSRFLFGYGLLLSVPLSAIQADSSTKTVWLYGETFSRVPCRVECQEV